MKTIIEGVKKFQREVYPSKQALFEKLASGQSPTALVISCADSRVDMQLVTQSEPGQLFFFRNAGNIVPPYGAAIGAISATIEYAMTALRVPNIVVCGHSDCGAMKGVMQPDLVTTMPTVAQWLTYADVPRRLVLEDGGDSDRVRLLNRLIHQNVLTQIDHLRTHPSVAVRLARGELQLHGWFYDISRGRVTAYDAEKERFVALDSEPMPHATPKASAKREILEAEQ